MNRKRLSKKMILLIIFAIGCAADNAQLTACTYPSDYTFLRRNLSLSYGEFEAREMKCADVENAIQNCALIGGRLPRFNTRKDLELIGEMHTQVEYVIIKVSVLKSE